MSVSIRNAVNYREICEAARRHKVFDEALATRAAATRAGWRRDT